MAGAYRSAAASAPAFNGAAVTPSDVTEIPVSRALYIGSGGTMVVVMAEGAQLTFVGVPTGVILPLQVKKVLATGTTAASILALY